MGNFSHTTTYNYPMEAVIAWHKRAGALTRATPPWAGFVSKDKAIKKGAQSEINVAFPGSKGLLKRKWTALITDIQERSFSDIMLEGPMEAWEHTHSFLETANHTVARDEIKYLVSDPIKARNRIFKKYSGLTHFAKNLRAGAEKIGEKTLAHHLEKVFTDRDRRIHADFDFQARYADVAPQTIVIAGASGMVGKQVSALLSTGGHTVRTLVRRDVTGENEFAWNPDRGEIDENVFVGADAVIHLGGASINTRFSLKNKKKILESRTISTELLARSIEQLQYKGEGPKTFVVASAIGYYGAQRRGEKLSENSAPGDDFLANVCKRWEQSTAPASESGVRVVNVRTGIVLSPLGGMLRMELPAFLSGVGGTIGKGANVQSWISLDDIAGIYVHAVLRNSLVGPVNAVASSPASAKEIAHLLGKALRRPAFWRIPSLVSDVLLGEEGTEQLILADQYVSNQKLIKSGYIFFEDQLNTTLKRALG